MPVSTRILPNRSFDKQSMAPRSSQVWRAIDSVDDWRMKCTAAYVFGFVGGYRVSGITGDTEQRTGSGGICPGNITWAPEFDQTRR